VESKEFKSLFGKLAIENSFSAAHGGWYRESAECLLVLSLQKSNFGSYFDLNIKVFVQGLFGNVPKPDKETIKNEIGDVFRRQPKEFTNAFELDDTKNHEQHKIAIAFFFNEFLNPFSAKALSRSGIIELGLNGDLHIMPAVAQQLDRLRARNL
jgi:hypothetical protein